MAPSSYSPSSVFVHELGLLSHLPFVGFLPFASSHWVPSGDSFPPPFAALYQCSDTSWPSQIFSLVEPRHTSTWSDAGDIAESLTAHQPPSSPSFLLALSSRYLACGLAPRSETAPCDNNAQCIG
ncbi:hypothetical protein GQ53DRAFT_751648 [Thozetella sp. PMI_491]|nr:hypothetical protein GQ53DRAFT_751648 [Thozetella sp. PMI_491]